MSCSGDGKIYYTDVYREDTYGNNLFNCHFGTAYEVAQTFFFFLGLQPGKHCFKMLRCVNEKIVDKLVEHVYTVFKGVVLIFVICVYLLGQIQ